MDSRTHGIMDYLVALVLIAAPYLFGFANGGPEQVVPQALGAVVILLSLLTAYELSIAKLIPYRVHLGIDVVQALFLLVSPWLLGYADRIWWPHVLVAIVEIVVVSLSWGKASSRVASA
jgi:hypothetical protein